MNNALSVSIALISLVLAGSAQAAALPTLTRAQCAEFSVSLGRPVGSLNGASRVKGTLVEGAQAQAEWAALAEARRPIADSLGFTRGWESSKTLSPGKCIESDSSSVRNTQLCYSFERVCTADSAGGQVACAELCSRNEWQIRD